MKNIPLLSIVIPTWNRTDSLFSLIESIGHKDDKELEIIISDDNSSPEIFQKVEAFCSDYSNVSLYKNSVNQGMVKNWNKCIHKAKGKWICFICDDDLFYTNGVNRIIQLIKENTEKIYLIIQAPEIINKKELLSSGIETVRQLNLPLVSGNLWHRQITDRLGGFDERIKYSPDAEFWYRIAYNYPVLKIREPFAKYISHENNYAYTTWTKDDFLDQVDLICRINSAYFSEKGEITHKDIIDLGEIGKDQTILTILDTTCMRKSKKELFSKYYKIGLERHKKRGGALSFRILILVLCVKRIISYIKSKSSSMFKKILCKSKVTLNFKKSFEWDWDNIHFNRIALVNLLCVGKLDGNYLEIGCQGNTLFDAVMMMNKIGVDPTAGGTHRKYSDDFFKENETYFDIIFIDGLHVYDQVHRDVANAIRFLKPGGWVAIHDMLPLNAIQEHVPNISPGPWTGDVWKVAFELIASPGIDFKLIKIDCGVGLFKVNDPNAHLKDFSRHLQNQRFQYLYENIEKLPLIELSEACCWIRSNK